MTTNPAPTGKMNFCDEPAAGPPQQSDLSGLVRNKPFGWLLLITGAIGWLASWALVLEKLEVLNDPGYETVCDINPWISCGKVMQSWQSSIFGFPNMFIGIVAFAIIITTGMALISGAVFARWYWIGLQLGVTLGFAFATWLWSQALYSIHVLCPLCMVVWAVMIPLFIWLTIRNIMQGAIKVPAQVARFVGPAGWLLVAVIYLGVAASIFFAFSHVFLNTPTL